MKYMPVSAAQINCQIGKTSASETESAMFLKPIESCILKKHLKIKQIKEGKINTYVNVISAPSNVNIIS